MDSLCLSCREVPTDGTGFLCGPCTSDLAHRLRSVGELEGELATTTARQVRVHDSIGVTSRNAEAPLPVNLRAADVGRDLADVLGVWADDVSGTCSGTAGQLAAVLLDRLDAIRVHPQADELLDEVADAISRAWRCVDVPPSMVYLGPCSCGNDLYAPGNAVATTCRDCGAEYRTDARREWLADQVSDQLASGPELARALPGLIGAQITPSSLRGLVHRGRIVARGTDRSGRKLYRTGDVIECVLG